jgi:hypothetical protein
MKLVNKTGYLKGAKTAKNPVNIIPSNLITTQGMAFPIKANGKTLYPNTGQYKFPTSHVVETPLKQKGTKGAKAKPKTKVDYNDGRTFNLSEGFRKRIYDSVNPDQYPLLEAIPALARLTSGRKITDEESADVTQEDQDAWAFYMGIPQKGKTVTKSKYTPTVNKTKNTKYYTVRNAYPAFEDSVVSNATKAFNTEKSFLKKLSDKVYGNKDTPTKRTGVQSSFRPLENVTYSKGKDKKGHYYSIYDTYNFDLPGEKKIGNPYEIYDRVYYDSLSGKPLSKKNNGAKLVKAQNGKLSVSANNKKQFMDVATNKIKPVKKGFSEPITFGQKPGSIGDKIGSILNLGSSRPGQGYSITPSTTAIQTGINYAGGKLIGKALKTPLAKKVGEYLTTKTPLKDAYKLNPFAGKPSPNKYYRTLGNEGYKDAVETKMLRARVGGDATGRPSDVAYFAKGKIGNYPGNNIVAEVSKPLFKKGDLNPVTKLPIKSRHGGYKNIDESGNASNIPLEDVKLLKKDWLKGYKEIPKMKEGSKGVSLAFSRGEKDPKGGLTQKGVDKYNRATGGNLKMAVTTPPSKLKAGSKAANRRKSFCARMSGVKGPMKKPNGEPSRKALALRKWNC